MSADHTQEREPLTREELVALREQDKQITSIGTLRLDSLIAIRTALYYLDRLTTSQAEVEALNDLLKEKSVELEAAERERNELRDQIAAVMQEDWDKIGDEQARVARLTARLEEAQEAIRQSPCSAFTHQSCLERAERGENPAGVRCPRCAYLEALAASSGVPGQERSRGTHALTEEGAERIKELLVYLCDSLPDCPLRSEARDALTLLAEARLGGANEPGEQEPK